ncbi:MAG TPA: hypothetical protein VKQ36_07900 [Ktedonobacterales bacterium]|nr:hypothetical protein [Ktedonobacterales bacterium]
MSESHSHHSQSTGDEVAHTAKHLAAEEHKAARAAHKVDSSIYMGEVLASGNPKRIEKYFLRKWLYRLFAKLMGKTVNRI